MQGSLISSIGSTCISIIAIVFMGVLLHDNSSALLATFSSNVLVLKYNSTIILANVPATLECQSILDMRNDEYNSCLSVGYMNCSTVSSLETQIQNSLSIDNLTSTRNTIQWACANRTNRLNEEISAFSATTGVGTNTTLIQNGTVQVTVQGGAYSIGTTYLWKRTIIGTEFKLDSLTLQTWSQAGIVSTTVNATITFDSFIPPLCLYQNQLPVYPAGANEATYFSGATVANFEGFCGSIVFNIIGGIDPINGVKLINDYGIFF